MVTDDLADGVRRVTDEDNLRHALKAEFEERLLGEHDGGAPAPPRRGLRAARRGRPVEAGRAEAAGDGLAGKLSDRELDQLNDYKAMQKEAVVDVAGKPTKIKQVVYEFTDPKGVEANLESIDDMLENGLHVKVYNASGSERTLTDLDDLDGLLGWLAQ